MMEHLRISKCVHNSKWQGDTLKCPCGRQLAVRYMIDDEIRVFAFNKFERYKQKILTRKDTYNITQQSDLLGRLGNEEWKEMLDGLKQENENT